MSTLYVDFCTTEKLPCTNKTLPTTDGGFEGYSVTLCLKTDALLKPFDCPAPSEMTEGAISYVPATICQAYNQGSCNPIKWYYTFSYSSEHLADENTPLQPADIDGVFCNDCMIGFLAERDGNEVHLRDEEDGSQTLISQHDCEYPIIIPPIPDGSITTEKIADGAVTSAKISIPWQDYSDTIVITGDGTNTLSAVDVWLASYAVIDKVGFINVKFEGTLSGATSNVINFTLPFTLFSDGGGLDVNMYTPIGLITGNAVFTSLTDVSVRKYDDTHMANGDYLWQIFGSVQLA